MKRYTVITGQGNWGKGATVTEAAKQAKVGQTFTFASVYYADPRYVTGEIGCDGDGHPIIKTKHDPRSLATEEREYFRLMYMAYVSKFYGELRMFKGELIGKLDADTITY